MIDLTQKAQEKLAAILKDQPDYKYVRIGVRGGGCSGLEYSIGLINEYEPDWSDFDFPLVTVYVDPLSLIYLDGVTVDYFESLTNSGFQFTNPNVKSSCGCGTSFSV